MSREQLEGIQRGKHLQIQFHQRQECSEFAGLCRELRGNEVLSQLGARFLQL